MNHPLSIALTNVIQRTWNEQPVRIRTMGGTVPMAPFAETFGFPVISIPVVNFDNNQHSENENLRLENLWKAIVTFADVLQMCPPSPPGRGRGAARTRQPQWA